MKLLMKIAALGILVDRAVFGSGYRGNAPNCRMGSLQVYPTWVSPRSPRCLLLIHFGAWERPGISLAECPAPWSGLHQRNGLVIDRRMQKTEDFSNGAASETHHSQLLTQRNALSRPSQLSPGPFCNADLVHSARTGHLSLSLSPQGYKTAVPWGCQAYSNNRCL